MSFFKSTDVLMAAQANRSSARDGMLSFGVKFLNDAMLGILKNDLILVGAGSGAGKTQFCCNTAAENISNGKKVHFIALEAELYEIENRILYQLFSKNFYAQKKEYFDLLSKIGGHQNDPTLKKQHELFSKGINFQNWSVGDYLAPLAAAEELAREEFNRNYQNLFTFYKTDKFGIDDLTMRVLEVSSQTDLIIVDHVHYFDFDDENENQAIKQIAKTARTLALENGKPIILVSHLRKRDRHSTDLVPGLEEFHGSSDLYKIATKAITLAPGAWSAGGKMETFFRIVKNRFDGSVTRVIGAVEYLASEGRYEQSYKIGDANQKRDDGFTELEEQHYPSWGKSESRTLRNFAPTYQRRDEVFKN